jgi:hypothetical protein
MPTIESDDPHSTTGAQHEARDVSLSGLLKFAVGLALLMAVVQLGVWLMMGRFESRAASEPAQYPLAAGEERVPPSPRLQVEPREDYKAYELRQRELLNSYHWIDQPTGVVGIPIEAAMKQVLERGLPGRAGVEKRDGAQPGK